MASVSHLPHVLANVLVAQAARVLSAEGERLPATGPSFRDVTRVAGANSVVWGGIYRANADALVAAIDDMVARLTAARDMLAGGDDDGIREWNDAAREDRRRLLESDLAGGEVHELRVLVPNRPGIVAEIALALGRATIDIVDMGLYPSSGSHGTVALWIRGGVVAEQAERLVRDLGLEVARGHEASASIRPGPLRGTLRAPGDKSMSHRAALFGAMCDDPVHVTGYLEAADTLLDAQRRARARRAGRGGRRPRHADDPRPGPARGRRGAHRRRQRRAR